MEQFLRIASWAFIVLYALAMYGVLEGPTEDLSFFLVLFIGLSIAYSVNVLIYLKKMKSDSPPLSP